MREEGLGGKGVLRVKMVLTEQGTGLRHVVEGEIVAEPQYESDRARFLGRGRDIGSASAIVEGAALSNTVGTVLDPELDEPITLVAFTLVDGEYRHVAGGTGKVEVPSPFPVTLDLDSLLSR